MLTRVALWIGFCAAGLAMLGVGVWGAMALSFRVPQLPFLGWALGLLAFAATVCLPLRRWRVVGLYGATLIALFVWWGMMTPSNDRVWAADVARATTGTLDGDRLEVRNVRNFAWRSDTDFDVRWETRTYDLRTLTGVDLFMSYWAGESIAHSILSFGFADGRHLAFSIEIRKEQHEAYSALAGFFRTYELSFVAADERDVVGVRTNVRDEDVRIYKMRMPPDRARALLLEYIAEANDLAARPRFYNSLTTNCTTQIYRMAQALQPDLPLDYRLLLAGYVPDYVYDRGGLDTRLPFERLRDLAHIKGRAASTDPDFSRLIRVGVPDPKAPAGG
jgi:hypothetical protein